MKKFLLGLGIVASIVALGLLVPVEQQEVSAEKYGETEKLPPLSIRGQEF